MAKLIITLLTILFAVSLASAFQDDDFLFDLFQDWQSKHSKSYSSIEEEQYRFEIFKNNHLYIQNYNSQGNTAILAHNKFSDLTNEEFAAKYASGLQPTQDAPINLQELEALVVDSYPAEFDWRTQGVVPPVGNEGECGTTWAWSVVQAVDAFHAIHNNNNLTIFSVAQVAYCDTNGGSNGCNGGQPTTAFSYIVKNGLETEEEYPYKVEESSKCEYNASLAQKVLKTWSAIPQNNFNLTQAAVFKTPISVNVESDQQVWQSYSGGVISSGCGTNVDHCVTAVGWTTVNGTKAWICENMWGEDWGADGYVYIAMDPTANNGAGVCGIYSGAITPLS